MSIFGTLLIVLRVYRRRRFLLLKHMPFSLYIIDFQIQARKSIRKCMIRKRDIRFLVNETNF
jgi:hypothetical protein